jgi:hypothetical protein
LEAQALRHSSTVSGAQVLHRSSMALAVRVLHHFSKASVVRVLHHSPSELHRCRYRQQRFSGP